MGLAFQGIAITGSVPFWQALISKNSLTSPEFSFFFARFVGDSSATQDEPGGVFTLGGTNSTLYQGSIDFQTFTPAGSNGSFWLQTVSGAYNTQDMCPWQCGGMINACLVMLFRCHPEWNNSQYRQRKVGGHQHWYDASWRASRGRDLHLGRYCRHKGTQR